MKKGLSKSRILAHRQCPKRLHLMTYRPELAEATTGMEIAFRTGNSIGELARTLVPGGRLIGHDADLASALAETTEALMSEPGRALFEATLQQDGVLVRADLLTTEPAGRVLTEVKAATAMQDVYLEDCAIQASVIETAGFPLQRIEVAHVDNNFIYQGDGNYQGLLKHVDVTKPVRSLMQDVSGWVESCRATLAGPEPSISVGTHCKDPYECAFLAHCRGPEPDIEYPVTMLYRGGNLLKSLIHDGYTDLRDVPEDRLKNPIQKRQRRTARTGQPELDAGARKILAAHPPARYYIDFETVQLAVPLWAGTWPYQQVPFQWSCHIETADGRLLHHEYLALPPESPMRSFAESLIAVLASEGPGAIFVYNQGFENTRLRELAGLYPDLAPALHAIIERVVDLLPIARNHYHHPSMRGSWSIKSVLPTIAPDLDYAQLEHVQDGGGAVEAYLELLDPSTAEERRTVLVEALRRYCALDTLAMVRLTRHMEGDEPSNRG